MRVTVLFLRIMIAIIFLSHSFGNICSIAFARCEGTPRKVHLKEAEAVFLGEVISIEKAESIGKIVFPIESVRFKVIKSWKKVNTAECLIFNIKHHEGTNYKVGETYMVLVSEMRDGKLMTGPCSGTVEQKYAQEYFKLLERWRVIYKAPKAVVVS